MNIPNDFTIQISSSNSWFIQVFYLETDLFCMHLKCMLIKSLSSSFSLSIHPFGSELLPPSHFLVFYIYLFIFLSRHIEGTGSVSYFIYNFKGLALAFVVKSFVFCFFNFWLFFFIFDFRSISIFRLFTYFLSDSSEVSHGFYCIILSLFIFKQAAVYFNFSLKNISLNNLWITFPSG